MRRHLDVVHQLLREPCPIDPSSLPRVEGGYGCAECGHTVVDVASLTFEEAAAFRRRARSGGARLCGAYTLDAKDRVVLKGAPGSSAVIAVAVSALLAACDVGNGDGKGRTSPLEAKVTSASARVRPIAAALSASTEPPAPTESAPSDVRTTEAACVPGHGAKPKGSAPSRRGSRQLAGF